MTYLTSASPDLLTPSEIYSRSLVAVSCKCGRDAIDSWTKLFSEGWREVDMEDGAVNMCPEWPRCLPKPVREDYDF